MSTRTDAQLRVARRAAHGAELLPVAERIQLFEDLATILPKDEARVAKDTAWSLRTALAQQDDFLSLLK